ncbi:hypothetical protein N431DRAFT_430584 [Stipitochalara longipes BDJ]|nr:hypothetical protein N431DRAFT_430584 [Stipitochalara longipes BDJ]
MSTFDAVSEFTAGTSTSDLSAASTGFISAIAIITIHILGLWHSNWTMSVAWILVVLGYCGIVFGVSFAAMLINWSCTCIKLDSGSSRTRPQWKEGMVVSVKNTDSLDTTGSNFVSSLSQHQNLEAVWIKSASNYDKSLATVFTIALVVSFIAHYLGLRAIIWWVSIGELCVCITAAFARSVSNEIQPRFEEVKGVKIDKRCISTGVIRSQTSRLVTEEDTERSPVLDARAYSLRALNFAPTVGERLAYLTAKLCLEDSNASEIILDLTGMNLHVLQAGQPEGIRGILTSFSGGIIVTEGLAFPNAQVCIAFRAQCSDLVAPTSLLARAIMRQPEWKLKRNFAKDIPLGNVYIFAMQSMLDWWTVSEDRNDMSDLQRNLHWPFFLVNLAFFIQLIRRGRKDTEILKTLEEAHGTSGEAEGKVAADVLRFIGRLPHIG